MVDIFLNLIVSFENVVKTVTLIFGINEQMFDCITPHHENMPI